SLGDYRLYKGVMRDEGPTGEGRDRATMVWNRHATYTPAAPPTTYFDLTDINLQLYHEDDGTLVDDDVTPLDNVQQVRIESGAAATPVVIKAYAWSTSFTHGGPDESFALATEEGFSQVSLPGSFTGEGSWPNSVEPDEIFVVGFRVRNDSETTSHNNTFDLDLPSGWSLVTGNEIQIVGSAPGSSGTSAYAVWEIRAPSLNPPGPEIFPIEFSHYSYGESWGTVTYDIHLTLEWDTTAPRPNPMFFTIPPTPGGLSEIDMQAVEATDNHEPVDYLHEYRSSPTGGAGGASSGWHRERDYTDTGLDPNSEYCYCISARDAATSPNATDPSADACTYTLIEAPLAPIATTTGPTTVEAQPQGTYSNLAVDSSGLRIDNQTASTDSGWTQSPVSWISDGLTPNSLYDFVTRSRNGDGIENPPGPSTSARTWAATPAPAGFATVTHQSVTARWSANGNPAGTEYLAENLTTGADSGWATALEWRDTSTGPENSYHYQVRARNADGLETAAVSMGTVETGFFGDGFEDGGAGAWSAVTR
ncbi:MAG: hypothetical protein V2I67_05155, partial [Thermoanaerobaculales bacterium]|nr:hypothetical protein [Thermoanaerobaculales bacterium]